MEIDCNHGVDRRQARRPQRVAHAIALSLIALFFIVVTLIGVNAEPLAGLVVDAPPSAAEGDDVTVTVEGLGNLVVSLDGDVVATGSGVVTATHATDATSAGVLVFEFSTDAPGIPSVTRSIEIADVPLVVSIASPDESDLAQRDVLMRATANWHPELCYVNVDGVSHTLAADSSPLSYSGVFALSDGVHALDYKCKLGSELATASKTVRVDTVPPVVVSSSPSGDQTGPHITITADTSEIAQCRYGPQDAPFDALPSSMGDTYATRNSALVTLDDDGPATYFIRCRDLYGNTMQSSSIISFTNRVPPIATISVDAEKPLRAGTYRVSVSTGVPLSVAPSLSYTLQESARTGNVVMEGDDDAWQGYLTIPDGTIDTVLSFAFSGTSVHGVVGNTIEEGALVTVDAIPPPPVSITSISNTTGGITLRWESPSDDVVSYRIFRDVHEGVDDADAYATISGLAFTDTSAGGARYYYYRVAAIDKAGNLGPLSSEVYGSTVDPAMEDALANAIDPVLAAMIDEELAAIASVTLDATQTIESLEQTANPSELRIIEDMSLIGDAREAMLMLTRAAESLRSLRSQSPSRQEVDDAIASSRSTIADARKLLVRRILLLQSIDAKQPSDADALRENVPFAIVGQNLDAASMSALFNEATRLNDRVTVSVSASTFHLYDAAGNDNVYTFIRKRMLLDEPANDVVVIEIIPKEVVADAADLVFDEEPVVLESDPVLQYSYPVLQDRSFSYYLKGRASMDDVKRSRTLLYPKAQSPLAPATAGSGTSDTGMLTGFATRIGLPYLPSSTSDLLLVLIGVVVIIGLGMYYLSLSPEPFKGMPGMPARPPRTRGPLSPPANGISAGRIISRQPLRRPSRPTMPFGDSARSAGLASMAAPATAPNASPTASSDAVSSGVMSMGVTPSGVTPAGAMPQAAVVSSAVRNTASIMDASPMARAFGANAGADTAVARDAADDAVPVSFAMSSEDVRGLLDAAERMIDSKSYDHALSAYKKALHALSVDEGLSQMLNDDVIRVYTKLLLFKRLDDARIAVSAKDSAVLRRTLDEARTLAAQLGDGQTVLMNDAKGAYELFVQELNRLEIDRAERY